MIIEYIASFIEIYIGLNVLGLVFPKKFEGKGQVIRSVTLSLILAVVICLVNRIELFSYVTILIGVLLITFFGGFLYKAKRRYLLLISSFYIMCMNYLDLIVIIIVGMVLGDSNHLQNITSFDSGILRIIQILLCKSAMIIVYCIVKKYVKIRFQLQYAKQLLLVLILSSSGIIYLIEKTLEAINQEIAMSWLIFSIIAALSMIVLILYWHSKEEHRIRQIIEMRNRMGEEKYNSLNRLYAANAKLYHDFRHHLMVIHELLKDNDCLQAIQYIENLEKTENDLSHVKWTGNHVIDIIINTKISEMKKEGISYSINVEFPQRSANIFPNDLCSVLSNLLENAIEACKINRIEKNKSIELVIRKINKMIFIKVENPMEIKPIMKEEAFLTSKKEKDLHGWGLKSVQSVVKKYGGEVKYNMGDKLFTVVVFMNLQKSDIN